MGTQATGTVLGIVADGETLAGWEIVATGDGGAITMKSGSCWGRYEGWGGSAEAGWDAVTARLWARLSDDQVRAKLAECRARVAAADGRMAKVGAQAALEATYGEAVKRGIVGGERERCDICGDEIVAGERFTDDGAEVTHDACVSQWFRGNFGRESLS